MTAILRKEKTTKGNEPLSKADRLAIKLGGKRFDINKSFDSPFDSDDELEDFLKWREDIRKANLEAQKDWRS